MSNTRNDNSWLTKLYAWACERLYTEFAGSYDQVSWLVSLGRWSNWRRAALNYLPPPVAESGVAGEINPALRVLEIGFGTGELLLEMARQGIQATGLELSPAMHKVTATKLHQQGLHVPRVRAVAQTMPLATASFDAIISTFPASYILDPATLQECARLLRKPQPARHLSGNLPGGRLVIVGLWVEIEQAFLRQIVPFFYGTPSPAFVSLCESRLTTAGLKPTFTHYRTGPVAVSVVVAERQ